MEETRLASIHVYPMKAARAVDLGESVVEPWGLAGDRRRVLADEGGRFVSQREEPALARVSVIFGTNGDAVTISSPSLPPLRSRRAPRCGDGEGERVEILEAA